VTLFFFAQYERIAKGFQQLPSLEQGQFSVSRFDNQELYAVIQDSVSGRRCSILGTIAPPDQQIVSFTLLAHTLKKEGARELTGILPYLAYTRQDKAKAGESLGAAWTGSLLKASGVDRVVTIDVHSERDKELFPIPLLSVFPADLFAATIRQRGWTDATIVAPDNGAVFRCEAVKAAMNIASGGTPYFEKQRTEKGVIHGRLVGEVSARVIIIDDMLDTGGTLVSACERLTQAGVREIYIFVTHGLFTGSKWKRLWSLRVKHIFCTDTIPECADLAGAQISVLSIAPLLAEQILRQNTG
jgi:ribose-phosphate pyrophosphokinase